MRTVSPTRYSTWAIEGRKNGPSGRRSRRAGGSARSRPAHRRSGPPRRRRGRGGRRRRVAPGPDDGTARRAGTRCAARRGRSPRTHGPCSPCPGGRRPRRRWPLARSGRARARGRRRVGRAHSQTTPLAPGPGGPRRRGPTRRRGVALPRRDGGAPARAVEAPPVVGALQRPSGCTRPERQRHVAVRAAVDQRVGRPRLVAEQHERPVHERDRHGRAPELPRRARRVPPPLREGDQPAPPAHHPACLPSRRPRRLLERPASSSAGPSSSAALRRSTHRHLGAGDDDVVDGAGAAAAVEAGGGAVVVLDEIAVAVLEPDLARGAGGGTGRGRRRGGGGGGHAQMVHGGCDMKASVRGEGAGQRADPGVSEGGLGGPRRCRLHLAGWTTPSPSGSRLGGAPASAPASTATPGSARSASSTTWNHRVAAAPGARRAPHRPVTGSAVHPPPPPRRGTRVTWEEELRFPVVRRSGGRRRCPPVLRRVWRGNLAQPEEPLGRRGVGWRRSLGSLTWRLPSAPSVLTNAGPVDEAALGGEEPPAAGLRAAVDRDVVAGDERRHVRRQEQRHPGLVLGPAEATDRRPRRPQVVGVLVRRRGSRPAGSA